MMKLFNCRTGLKLALLLSLVVVGTPGVALAGFATGCPGGQIPLPYKMTNGTEILAYACISASPASVSAANAKCGDLFPFAIRISTTEMLASWQGYSSAPGTPNNTVGCWSVIIPCSMGIANGLAYRNAQWSMLPGGVCTYL